MLTATLIAFGLTGTCFVLLIPVLVRLFRSCDIEEVTAEWLTSFNPRSYDSMHGLLATEDFQFLVRQPGFDFSLYRKLRKERMLIFRQYLRRLIRDFNRLHAYARLVVATSEKDQSGLILQLALLKLRFTGSVLQAELSYYLCLAGIGSLATHAVVARLEEMSSQLNEHLIAA